MALSDLLHLLVETLRTRRLRTALTTLGTLMGMAAVVLVSSLSEGARQGVLAQLTQFGATIIGVQPGREHTFGAAPGMLGGTTHPLTVEDGLALRRIPGVLRVAPHTVGIGLVEAGRLERRTYIYGTVADDEHILGWHPRLGSFLPPGDPDAIPAVCVLGSTVAGGLFPSGDALGARIRIEGVRYRVVGVMGAKGQMMGFDLDDMVYVPVRRALAMFDREAVQEIHVLAQSHERIHPVMEAVAAVLKDRHDGEEDVTIVSQADMLALVNEVMEVMTVGVMVIAAISVLVGAMGILTIMWVSVHERTSEIGLVKALGASDGQVLLIFLAEAAFLSLLGGAAGVAAGLGLARVVHAAIPGMLVHTPPWIVPLALLASLSVGLLAGVLPALRAARLDPLEALRAE